jgi:3-hydroxybutyryl-CoA dehydrogenase
MILAVLANDLQKEEIAVSAFFRKHEVLFSENISLWNNHIADAFIDLSFENSPGRIEMLAKLLPKPVLVHSVTDTLDRIHPNFIRVNGWPGFLKGNCLEASSGDEIKIKAEQLLGEDLVFVKDAPGFVSARILAMIINEAYFTWEAGTSTKDEIDIAMKLGTGWSPLLVWRTWKGKKCRNVGVEFGNDNLKMCIFTANRQPPTKNNDTLNRYFTRNRNNSTLQRRNAFIF